MGNNCTSSSTAALTSKSSIKVHYWGPHQNMRFYGRAIGIYLTLDQAGLTYEKCPPTKNLPVFATIGSEAPKAYAPPLVEVDGNFMAQTPQVLAVLGEMCGLAGGTRKENMQVLHALGDLQDVFDLHSKFETDVALKDKWFKYLEMKLERHKSEGSRWMGGTKGPSVADFHGVFTFCWIVGKNIEFTNYPNLTQWWKDIKAVPVVANMIGSCSNTDLKMVPV